MGPKKARTGPEVPTEQHDTAGREICKKLMIQKERKQMGQKVKNNTVQLITLRKVRQSGRKRAHHLQKTKTSLPD